MSLPRQLQLKSQSRLHSGLQSRRELLRLAPALTALPATAPFFAGRFLQGQNTPTQGMTTQSRLVAVPQLSTDDWHPERLSTSVLSIAQGSFTRMANRAQNQQLIQSDMQSAAHSYWALYGHLHEVGFHAAAFKHLARHHRRFANPDPAALAAYFQSIQQNSGLEVPESIHAAVIQKAGAHLGGMFSAYRTQGVGHMGRSGARALAHFGQQLPASAARYQRLREFELLASAAYANRNDRNYQKIRLAPAYWGVDDTGDCGEYNCAEEQAPDDTSDGNVYYIGDYEDTGEPTYASPTMPANWCWAMEWAGLYIAVLGLAIAAIPPLGIVLTFGGIAMMITGLLFNC